MNLAGALPQPPAMAAVADGGPGRLPSGVKPIELEEADDGLGRALSPRVLEGPPLPGWPQWNLVSSHANTLRGVHVHPWRYDYLLVLRGSLWLGVYDLRRDSPTRGESGLVHVVASSRQAWVVPPGVAHGFCFTEGAVYCYALSSYWSPDRDDYACHWNDPALNLAWPLAAPLVSPRDHVAGSLADLQQTLAELGPDTGAC